MRKLMWFAVGFGLAAVIGMYFLWGSLYFPAAGITAVLLAVSIWLMGRWKKLRIAVAILLGCAVGFTWMSVFDSLYLAVPRAADGQRLTMTLTATDYSEETSYGLSVRGFGTINGRIYEMTVYLDEETPVSPGDRVTGSFLLRATLPGCAGYSTYQAADRIFLTATLKDEATVRHSEKLPWYGYPAYVRQLVKQTLNEALPEDTAGFAIALLIGDTEGIDYETDTAFKISGIRHFIAVSGLHVTILFSLVYFLVGRKRVLAMAIGMPVLFFFAAVAGFSPSILRACLMHGLMAVAMLSAKEYDPPTALSFAVIVMLTVDPWMVTSVSFQLSVACVAGMLLFADPVRKYLMDRRRLGRFRGRKRKIANWFASSVGASLGATVLVTPLCAWYFGMVSLVSVLTNLLTLWIVTFIFYGAMAVCLVGLIWLPVGKFLGWILAWPVRYVLAVAKGIAAFPLAAVYTDSIYILAWLIFAYGLFVIFLASKKKPIAVFSCCVALGLCLALTISWLEPRSDECRVTILDVGQGQCIILQSEGKTFVVDCGGDSDTGAADTAAAALMSQGIFDIDGLILTHYDRDHGAGVEYLLTRVSAQNLYLPNCADEDGVATTLPTDISRTIVGQITTITYGNTKITLIPSFSDLSDNESGLCVLFQTENCDILITGDRSIEGEQELMETIDLPQLELLVVGHHGSKYSTGTALLEKTSPDVAVISVGENNNYGHPTQAVLDRLSDAGCVIYRTDRDGTVVYRG